jgi:hypothetical protein
MFDSGEPVRQVTTYQKIRPILPVRLKGGGWRIFLSTFVCKDWSVREGSSAATLSEVYYLKEEDITALKLQSLGDVVSREEIQKYS